MFTRRNAIEWVLLSAVVLVVGGALVSEWQRVGRSQAEIDREVAYYRTQAAIELYAHQHQGESPKSLDLLVVRTDGQGNESADGRFGPYLNELPGGKVFYTPAAGLRFAN